MGSSAVKIAANQKNAAKSTGPKTVSGKKASSANATRHAVLSSVPVLPGVESTEAWEAHRSATIASLAPSGYLETTLADRVASLLWRLGRVQRYETENTTSKLETAEKELSDRLLMDPLSGARSFSMQGRAVFGTTPEQLREEVEIRTEITMAYAALLECEASDSVPPEYAEKVLRDVSFRADVDLDSAELPFLPPAADELGWGKWTGWTKTLVLQVADAVLARSKKTSLRKDGVEAACLAFSSKAGLDVLVAERALRELEGRLQRNVRALLLLPEAGLEKVARYETHLERSLYKALHELQRLQAARDGTGGAPMALDVDVSVGPRLDGRETYDENGEPIEP